MGLTIFQNKSVDKKGGGSKIHQTLSTWFFYGVITLLNLPETTLSIDKMLWSLGGEFYFIKNIIYIGGGGSQYGYVSFRGII